MARRSKQPSGGSAGSGLLSGLLETLRRQGITISTRGGHPLPDPQVLLPHASDAFDDEDWDEDDWDEDEDEAAYGPDDEATDASSEDYPSPLTAAEILAGGREVEDDGTEQLQRIAQALDSLRVFELRAIGTYFGWKLAGQRREDVLAGLLAHYTDEDSLAKARARLTADERRLMALIRALQFLNMAYLRRALATIGTAAGASGAAFDGERQLRDALRHGLIFDLQGYLICPLGLFTDTPAATDLLPPPPDLRKLTVVPAPDPLRSLAFWVEQAAADPLICTIQNPFDKTGRPAPQGWHPGSALTVVPVPDEHRPLLVPPVGSSFAPQAVTRLDAALGLSRSSATELLLWVFIQLPMLFGRDLPAKSDLFRATAARVIGLKESDLLLLLFQFWQGLPYGMYDEWSWTRLEDKAAAFDVELLRAWNRSADPVQAGFVRSRREIAGRILNRLLRADPAQGGWMDMTAFLRFAGQIEPRSAMGGSGSDGWQLTDRKGKPLTDWHRGGGTIWRYLIEVPLHTLGLVDLARDTAGVAQALRLSAMGRDLLEPRATAAVTSPEAQWTTADTVVLPMRWDHLPLLTCLGLCCALVSVKDGRACFRLDRTASQATFRAGGDAEAIQQALAARHLTLPPAAVATLQRWSASWGQWMLRADWSLLTFADEATAQEVMAGGALDKALACRLSPTHWLVAPDQADEVLAALKRAGHRPMVHDAPPPRPTAAPRRTGR
ncbi:MAG TPA: hypothetical protein PLZ56_02305 [Anaerolineae bacterium]|nr:hypothetical protein [Anaerolineae bacterium]